MSVPESRPSDALVARLERIPMGRFHYRIMALLSVGTFFDAYDSLTIAIALTVIFRTLHISFVNAGVLIGIAYLGQFIGANAFGYLSERYGRKTSFIIASVIFGVFSLLAALSWNYGSLFWFRFFEGIGLGGEVPVAGALFSEFVQGRRRGFYVTIYETIFAWGLFATPLVGYLLIAALGPALGWRVLFAIGFVPVLNGLVALRWLPESVRWQIDHGHLDRAEATIREMEASAERHGVRLAEPKLAVRADVKPTRPSELFSPQYRRRTALAWLQWFCAYFVVYGYGTWLPSLYVRLGHLPPQQSLLVTAVSSLIGVGVTYSIAWFLDGIGRRPVFTFGFGLATAGALIGFAIVSLTHVSSWVPLFVAALVMGMGGNINAAGVYVYTPELYPTRMRGLGTAVASSMNRVASFISPLLVGVLLNATGGLSTVFLMFAVVSAIGLVTMWRLGIETRQKLLEEIAS